MLYMGGGGGRKQSYNLRDKSGRIVQGHPELQETENINKYKDDESVHVCN